MGLAELAKQIGIQLTADAIVAITNRMDKLKKDKKVGTGGKTISDHDKIKIIKAYVDRKKPTMREVAGEKGGGYIKKYAKGGGVRKPKLY